MREYLDTTKDYTKFESHSFNRNVKTIKTLISSMEKYGFHPGHPLHVIKRKNRFVVKDGHNRLEAARILNLPVKFIVCKDDIKITEIISATNPWTTKDFLDSYTREGHIEYIAVKKYMKETGISLGASMALLAGTSVGSGNQVEKFKTGDYSLGHPWLAEKTKDIILEMKALGIPFATSSLFVHAISKTLWIKEMSTQQLKLQFKKYNRFLKKQPNIDGYLKNIQQVYNHRNSNKLPLAFLAEEAKKERLAAAKATLTEE